MKTFKQYLIESDELFTTKTTDMPLYDEMMKNPKYYAERKDKEFDVVYMSPEDYINEIILGFWEDPSMKKHFKEFDKFKEYMMSSRTSKSNIENLSKISGKLPMPVIEYMKSGDINQEGHHRAEIAKQRGIRKIPVLVVNKKYRGSYNEL